MISRSSPRRPRLARLATLLAVATAAGLAACGGGADSTAVSGGPNGGTVIVSTNVEPNTLLPQLTSGIQGAAVVAQVFDRLAEIGDSLNSVGDVGFRPRLARAWRWAPDSLSIAFQLDPRARWHDGKPVRAADVKFTFDVAVDPATGSSSAALLSNIDSVSTPDSLTAVFWYKRRTPQQFYEATYELWVIPQHLLGNVPHAQLATAPFGRAPVGTGRFRFVSWTPGQRLEIAADKDNYRGRAHLDRVVWVVTPDISAATISLINGNADFLEIMRSEYLGQLARNKAVRVVPYPGLVYMFLLFNERAADGSGRPHPLFADRELRRALTMAVDRRRVTTSVYDSSAEVGIGPATRAIFPDWPKLRQIPYDPVRARQLLDSLGWTDPDGDGVRAKNGTPLAFSIVVPTSSAPRARAAVVIQEQLRAVGAQVTIDGMEMNASVERQRSRRFDATISGFANDPSPGGVRQTWGALGAAPGGSNWGAYVNPAFDAAVESALDANDPARSRAQWLRAYQTIIDDAPAIWLFEPHLVAGAHQRLHLTRLRADGWWIGLADWTIPPGERIGRDRVGLR